MAVRLTTRLKTAWKRLETSPSVGAYGRGDAGNKANLMKIGRS